MRQVEEQEEEGVPEEARRRQEEEDDQQARSRRAGPPVAPAPVPTAPSPQELAEKAKQATIDAFNKAHFIWTLNGSGQAAVVSPNCTALSDTLAKCDFTAQLRSEAFAVDRTGKSTVGFYPYGIDAVLSEETCTELKYNNCGLF